MYSAGEFVWGQIINGGTCFYYYCANRFIFLFGRLLPTVGRLLIQTQHTHEIISDFWKPKFMVIKLLCFYLYTSRCVMQSDTARILILKYSPITCLRFYKKKYIVLYREVVRSKRIFMYILSLRYRNDFFITYCLSKKFSLSNNSFVVCLYYY